MSSNIKKIVILYHIISYIILLSNLQIHMKGVNIMVYSDLEEKYRKHLKGKETFHDFLQKILKEYFEEETVIDQLFELKYEDNHIISNKELEIMDKEEKIYEKFILLCGKENRKQVEELLAQVEDNYQDLIDIYAKEFYKLGIKDAKSFKKNS